MKHKLRVCNRHEGNVPLIWTFAFAGAEYWCPCCGANYGMLGAGEIVEVEYSDMREAVRWRQKSREFLDARSTLVCDSLIWEGERIDREDLPLEEVERCSKIVKEYKYQIE